MRVRRLNTHPWRVAPPARISHQLPAAGADATHPAVFSRFGVLHVRSSTSPRPSGRKPHWARRLAALATKPGEICGLLIAAALLATPGGAADSETAVATLAAGCFWCIEADFEKVEGVLSVTSGYTGGSVANPTYKQVSKGKTGHTEAVRVVFDPRIISYEHLLEIFWRNIDPTVDDRQFCDVGKQYRAGIFYHDEEQRQEAEKSRAVIEQTKPFANPIVTEIAAATAFYPAEAYHQDYFKKNPIRYAYYRKTCGRDRRLKELWGETK